MAHRRMMNPKMALLVGAAVLALTTVIAVILTVSYSPEPGYRRAPTTQVTPVTPAEPARGTSTFPVPPPPPQPASTN